MKLAIQRSMGGMFEEWKIACKDLGIEAQEVDVYSNDAITQIRKCDGFLWQWHHASAKDWLFARQLMASLGAAGVKVFPNIETCWHFDDKVGQKYLFEALEVPTVQTWVFYDKDSALKWADETEYPKIFKLRGGAGATNVKMVKSKLQARRLICKMFGRGFASVALLSDISTNVRLKKKSGQLLANLLHAPTIIRNMMKLKRMLPRQRGYAYFQENIPKNEYDTRIVVIGDKAIGIRRYCRPNDFRASGSGNISYAKADIPIDAIRISFDAAKKMKSQCCAFDFVRDQQGQYRIIEVSYGFTAKAYEKCEGYWSPDLVWHDEQVALGEWIIRDLISCDTK